MNSDNKFWLGVWSIVGVTLMSLFLCTACYWIHFDSSVVKALALGVPAEQVKYTFSTRSTPSERIVKLLVENQK